jgi:hypothetical protein
MRRHYHPSEIISSHLVMAQLHCLAALAVPVLIHQRLGGFGERAYLCASVYESGAQPMPIFPAVGAERLSVGSVIWMNDKQIGGCDLERGGLAPELSLEQQIDNNMRFWQQAPGSKAS